MKSKWDTAICPNCGEKILKNHDISKNEAEAKWHHTNCKQPDLDVKNPQETLPETPTPNAADSGQQIGTNENLKKTLENPKPRDFDDERIKIEAREVNSWSRSVARAENFKDFDVNGATTDAIRAKQIDTNVDKKALMDYFFKVKYGTKKDKLD